MEKKIEGSKNWFVITGMLQDRSKLFLYERPIGGYPKLIAYIDKKDRSRLVILEYGILSTFRGCRRFDRFLKEYGMFSMFPVMTRWGYLRELYRWYGVIVNGRLESFLKTCKKGVV